MNAPHGVSHIDQGIFFSRIAAGRKEGWLAANIMGKCTMLSHSGGSEGKMEAEGKMNGCREKERG